MWDTYYFCCVHNFIDFAWVRKPFIFSLTHDLFWMDIQCSWVRRMSRMSHCDSKQKKKWNNTLVSVLPHFLHANTVNSTNIGFWSHRSWCLPEESAACKCAKQATCQATFYLAEDGSNELKLVQRLIKLCPQELDHSLKIIELGNWRRVCAWTSQVFSLPWQ